MEGAKHNQEKPFATLRRCAFCIAGVFALRNFFRRIRAVRWRRVFLYIIALWLGFALMLASAIHFYGQMDHARPSDVIIFLGGGMERDNQPGPPMIRRADHAANLWHQGIAPYIICTGGTPGWATRSEADGCAELLQARGVPSEAIVLESQARSTEENAEYSKQIMESRGWRMAVLVSDGYHMLRAHWIFQAAGIDAVTSPTPEIPPPFDYLYSISREVAALHWQALKQILNLPFTYVPIL
jgi:uncharacterized SAM-binding protein YcdF (DUF218 family)